MLRFALKAVEQLGRNRLVTQNAEPRTDYRHKGRADSCGQRHKANQSREESYGLNIYRQGLDPAIT